MRINQSVRYGVACLFELSRYPGEFIDAEKMARSLNIPPAYTHKVLQTMAREGLVIGQKGLGYKLSRSLAFISARDVVEALTKDNDPIQYMNECGTRFEEKINLALSNVMLADLAI